MTPDYNFLEVEKRSYVISRTNLIREPELRWPIVRLVAIITAAIALVAAGMQYFALTQPYLLHTTGSYGSSL